MDRFTELVSGLERDIVDLKQLGLEVDKIVVSPDFYRLAVDSKGPLSVSGTKNSIFSTFMGYELKVDADLEHEFAVECFTEMSKANADEKLKEIYRSLCESGE